MNADTTDAQPTNVKSRLPYASLAFIGFMVASTFGNAAANMIPFHVPTTHELQQREQNEVAAARHARVIAARAGGDPCELAASRDRARDLVFDGQSARAYVAAHMDRCGEDPVLRHWANAPVKVPPPAPVLVRLLSKE